MFTQSPSAASSPVEQPLQDDLLRSSVTLTGERLAHHHAGISPILLNGLMLSVSSASKAQLAIRYQAGQRDDVLVLSEQKSIDDIAKVDDHSVAVLMSESTNYGLTIMKSVVLVSFDAEQKCEVTPVDLGKDLVHVFTMGRAQELVTLHQGFDDDVMLEAYDYDDMSEGIVQPVAQWKRWDLSNVSHPVLKSTMKTAYDEKLDHHEVLLHASDNHFYVRIHQNWYLWNTEQVMCQPEKLKLASSVVNLRELPKLETIVTFKKYGTVQFFDLDFKAVAPYLDLPSVGNHEAGVGARVTPDGKHVLIWRSHTDTRLSLLDVKARQIVETLDLTVAGTTGPQQITFVTNPASDGQVGVEIVPQDRYQQGAMLVALPLSAFKVLAKLESEKREERVVGISMFQPAGEKGRQEEPGASMTLGMK